MKLKYLGAPKAQRRSAVRAIDPDLFRSLVAFDETGSLARAADRVGRTESAISLQMKKLEELIGRPMFKRSGRRLIFTDDGYVVLNYARRILAMNDELLNLARKQPVAGRLRIAGSQDFGEELLPRVLQGLSRRYPDVKFEVQIEGGMRGLQGLERGEVDLVLTIGLDDHPSARRLHRARLEWIANPGFVVRPDAPVPLVTFNHSCRFKQRAIEVLNHARIPWEIVFSSPSLAGLWAATRANIGLTVRSSYWIPPGLVALGATDCGLPDLGDTDVTIHYYEHTLAPELIEVVRFIERSVLLEADEQPSRWGAFKADAIGVDALGTNQPLAQKVYDRAAWK